MTQPPTSYDRTTGKMVPLLPAEIAAMGPDASAKQIVLDRFRETDTRPSFGFRMGQAARGVNIPSQLARSGLYGGLTAATIAALMLGGRTAFRRMSGDPTAGPSVGTTALAAGLGGLGAAAYGALSKASAMSDEGLNGIRRLIMQANELSMAQKQEAVDLASSLPPSEAQQLQQLLRLAAGFGVGALLARFFGARGFLLTTFGGLGGAFVASQLRRSSTDRFGQPLQTGRDWQGKAF